MSSEHLLGTRASPFRKVRATNQTSNGYVSKIPTVTRPTGDANTATGASIIELSDPDVGGWAFSSILLLPYAIGSNNNTFSLRVIGWSPMTTDRASVVNPSTQIWIPQKLIEVACTISSTPIGIAGAAVLNTELFADTITLTGSTANAGVNCDIVSPADDTIGSLLVDLKGSMLVEVSFTTGGSATSCNALYKLL